MSLFAGSEESRSELKIVKKDRKIICEVLLKLKNDLKQENKISEFDLFYSASDCLKQNNPIFTHLIVDEAQDLGPEKLYFIRQLVSKNSNDIMLCGDSGQSLYKRHTSWIKHGLDIRGRSHGLKINYRTSKEIKQKDDKKDEERLQTVYAKHLGAVAAPAAGLHFTEILLKKLELKGVHIVNITSHTGLGTFKDIDVEDLTKHKMDSENYAVPKETEIAVNKALENNKRIFAVGTSSMKTLETAVSANDKLKSKSGWTDKFIFPPYEFKICGGMITNFHSPKSTLLMMATAFGGFDTIMKAYKVAIKEKYMFHTYGDALLII